MQKKLNRKEIIFNKLEQLTEEQIQVHNTIKNGFTTEYIANILKFDRANVSKDLNGLSNLNKIIKIKGKPVYFLSKDIISKHFDKKLDRNVFESMDDFLNNVAQEDKDNSVINKGFFIIGANGSLKQAVEQAKAAVIYPPNGLSTLITGPTGVGKSMFAEYMYKFGLQTNHFSADSPFVVFNCADYSENQSLLLSQLFGYVKGAFTGADFDKEGLVYNSNNGILFLDEVHRLSAEGQEMLFLLMDKGVYRRLGEAEATHKSNVMIIAATTENPENVMLDTFLRRIPVLIKLPSLKDRDLSERMDLICHFFQAESTRVQKNISVSKEVLKAFLFYECKGNIGQLKSDIQLICARAFLDCMTYGRQNVEVKLSLLSNNVLEGLYHNENREQIMSEVRLLGKDNIDFYPNSNVMKQKDMIINEKYNVDFYSTIQQSWDELEKSGKSEVEIRSILDKGIQKYSFNLMNTFLYNNDSNTVYEKIIAKNIEYIVSTVLMKYKEWSEKKDIEKLIRAITLHVQNMIERIRVGNVVNHPHADVMIQNRVFEANVANELLSQVAAQYQIQIPKDEIVYMASFLYLTMQEHPNKSVSILVIMHGESTASSMANVANQLLGTKHAHAIDMDLNDKIQDVMVKAIDLSKKIYEGKGILLLTDMGSILSFAKIIEDATSIPVLAIDQVSTPILLEATRLSLNPDMSLESLYNKLNSMIHVNDENTIKIDMKDRRYFENLLLENTRKVLTFLDVEKAYVALSAVLKNLSYKYQVQISDDVLVKFIFHGCCMIERSIVNNSVPYKNCEQRIQDSLNFYNWMRKEMEIIEDTFAIVVSDSEIANVLDLFEIQYGKDIFL